MSVAESPIGVDFQAASTLDAWLEDLAAEHDPDNFDPATWPAWTDRETWELGASDDCDPDEERPTVEVEPFEPSPDDLAYLGVLDDRAATMEQLIEADRFEAWVEMQANISRSLATWE